MNYYDIEKIYDEMEQYLIENIERNLMSEMSSFHLKEEKELGFNWEAWQAAKLRELKRYRKENKNILNKYVGNIDEDVADVLRREYQQGKKSAYKSFKMALEKGYESSVKVKDSFFGINDRKIDALIKSINNDFKKANQAVLRMTNDTYRQVIFEASMYNTTGVLTGEEAIRKAIGNFEARGINSIVYSNGARHKISNYARMAIRTASTRAYLQGNGEFRKKIGQTLVILSKHGTACELCQPWEGRVLIDDIYSGGSKEDGNYPLLSDAMKQGLYHPNCRHALGTYYPELEEEENKEIVEEVEKEEQEIELQKATKQTTQKVDVAKKTLDSDLLEKKPTTKRQRRKQAVKDVVEEASGHATEKVYKKLSEQEIDNLQESSNIAYNKFTKHGREAIEEYTMGAYQDVNDYLNGKFEGFNNIEDMIADIDKDISEYHLEEDIITYRGTHKEFYSSFKVDDEFTLDMYNSTSLNENIANTFMEEKEDPLMLEIRVPKETECLYIGDNTSYEFEAELLLKRGLTYKVVEIQETKIILEVVK